jgi:hypothetical protein
MLNRDSIFDLDARYIKKINNKQQITLIHGQETLGDNFHVFLPQTLERHRIPKKYT